MVVEVNKAFFDRMRDSMRWIGLECEDKSGFNQSTIVVNVYNDVKIL